MVRKNRKIVDVGTDHAYLPVYLVQNGISRCALACDVGEKPLENARKTVELFKLRDFIKLRISDGLKNVEPAEAEEIIICGLGGTLIAEILSHAPFIKKRGIHLVLQPMTHSEDLRRFLCENGFAILNEECVVDSDRLYCCLSAEYSGKDESADPGYYYFGSLIGKKGRAGEFAEKQYDRVCKKYRAMISAGLNGTETQTLLKVKSYYERQVCR